MRTKIAPKFTTAFAIVLSFILNASAFGDRPYPYLSASGTDRTGYKLQGSGQEGSSNDPGPGIIYVVYCLDTEPAYTTGVPGDPVQYHGVVDTGNFNNYPGSVLYQVMQPSFRALTSDSYGDHIKLTWFLLASEIECQSTLGNCLLSFDLMQHFDEEIAANADEISWHFHNTDWQSKDGSATSGFWTQLMFFDRTPTFDGNPVYIAETIMNKFLLDRNWFPTSFRSGWTWENDDMSNWLEGIAIFDYSRLTPLAENYDWSRTPPWPEISYYHPSFDDYQSPGSMQRFLVQCNPYSDQYNWRTVDSAINRALQGNDVILSFYSHAPSSLVTKVLMLDSLIQAAKVTYGATGLKFVYNTATEAMRGIRGLQYSHGPNINASYDGQSFYFQLNEQVAGYCPYVAVKFSDSTCTRLQGTPIGNNIYRYDLPAGGVSTIVRIGIAATDQAGNISIRLYSAAELLNQVITDLPTSPSLK